MFIAGITEVRTGNKFALWPFYNIKCNSKQKIAIFGKLLRFKQNKSLLMFGSRKIMNLGVITVMPLHHPTLLLVIFLEHDLECFIDYLTHCIRLHFNIHIIIINVLYPCRSFFVHFVICNGSSGR